MSVKKGEMMSVLLARLEIRWCRGKLFFFDPESEMHFDVFRPYPEIANLAITIRRKRVWLGSGTVWISSERKYGASPLSFIGFEDYFGFSPGKDSLRFEYLTPYFFIPGDVIEIHDAMNDSRFLFGRQRRQRFIEAVFKDFMTNSLYGIEGVELLWEEFLSMHNPSHAVIAAMLKVSRQNAFLSLCLCGDEGISNPDMIQGNKLRDLWIALLEGWQQKAISREYLLGVISLRGE